MTNRLAGKVAMITGAGGGIGRAGSKAFAAEGAKVIVAEIDRDSGQETVRIVQDLGGQAVFVHTDVTQADSVVAAVAAGQEALGPLNILYNNAGYSMETDRPIDEVSEEVWKETYSVVLYGSFLCAKYAIPEIIKNGGGCVISTASVAGLAGSRNSAYSTAKGGVVAMTKTLALQYADKGVRANVICPGLTFSPRLKQRHLNRPPEEQQRTYQRQPLGICDPEDIANAAVFLASDDSRMMTGQSLVVDGGYMLGVAPAL